MRVGSLEILGALSAFGLITARLRAGTRPKTVTLSLMLEEAPAMRSGVRQLTLTVAEGSPSIIGRSSQADLEVADPEVSRRHAQLDLVRGVLYLADAGSSNGTFLNGKLLGDDGIELRPGDDIDVGNTRIRLGAVEPAV